MGGGQKQLGEMHSRQLPERKRSCITAAENKQSNRCWHSMLSKHLVCCKDKSPQPRPTHPHPSPPPPRPEPTCVQSPGLLPPPSPQVGQRAWSSCAPLCWRCSNRCCCRWGQLQQASQGAGQAMHPTHAPLRYLQGHQHSHLLTQLLRWRQEQQ
jgi:hypothetical protein